MGRTEYDNIDLIGNNWEDKNTDSVSTFNRYDKVSRERIVKNFLLDEKRAKVLDLGCSTGAWIDFFRKVHCGEVTGVDISKDRLKIAKKRGYDKVVCANGTKLPFKNNHFDVVVCVDVLVHTLQKKSWEKVFEEVHRILRPGGLFIFSIANVKGKAIDDFVRSPVRLKNYIFRVKEKDTSRYCVIRSKKETSEMIKKADFRIEKTVGQRFSYPDFLIYIPSIMHALDFSFGRTPFNDYARVIFFKVRK